MSEKNRGEQNLDALLQDWAVRYTLPEPRYEAIRRAILFEPESPVVELSVAWWHKLFATAADAVRLSTDMRGRIRLTLDASKMPVREL